jgi:hypothetical protein
MRSPLLEPTRSWTRASPRRGHAHFGGVADMDAKPTVSKAESICFSVAETVDKAKTKAEYSSSVIKSADKIEELASKKNTTPMEFLRKANAARDRVENHYMKKMLSKASNTQLCFVIDGTSSMIPQMSNVNNIVSKIIKDCKKELTDRFELAVSCVVYRDPEYEKYRARHIDSMAFTTDFTALERFLQSSVEQTSASIYLNQGDGDVCEDVIGGLNAAKDLAWSNEYPNKILVVCGDAPCHGEGFYLEEKAKSYDTYFLGGNRSYDHQPQYSTSKISRILQTLNQMPFTGKFFVAIAPTETDVMLTAFKDTYKFDLKRIQPANGMDGFIGDVSLHIKTSIVQSARSSVTRNHVRKNGLPSGSAMAAIEEELTRRESRVPTPHPAKVDPRFEKTTLEIP